MGLSMRQEAESFREKAVVTGARGGRQRVDNSRPPSRDPSTPPSRDPSGGGEGYPQPNPQSFNPLILNPESTNENPAPPPAKPPRSWRDLFRKEPDALPSFEAILEAQQAARARILSWNLPDGAGSTPDIKPSKDAAAFLALVALGYSPRLLRACHAEYLRTSDKVKSGFLQALTTFFGTPGGKAKATFEGLLPQAEALLTRNDALLASQAPPAPDAAPSSALPSLDIMALPGVLPFS